MHYFSYTFIQLFYSGGFITLRAKLSGAVYCNRSCLCVYNGRAGVVCVWVCYHDNSKLCTSIFTGSVYSDRLQLIQFWSPPGRGSAAGLCVIIRPARSVCVSPSAFFNIVIIIYCLRHLQYRGRGNKKSVKKMETLECPCWLKIVVEQDSELNRWMTTDNLRNRKALSLSLSRHLTGRRSFSRDPSKTDKLSHWVDQATPLQLAGRYTCIPNQRRSQKLHVGGGPGAAYQRRLPTHHTPRPSPSAMGGATDFKVGVQNRTHERSERKKKFLYPHFSKCGRVQASKYQ